MSHTSSDSSIERSRETWLLDIPQEKWTSSLEHVCKISLPVLALLFFAAWALRIRSPANADSGVLPILDGPVHGNYLLLSSLLRQYRRKGIP